MVNTGTVAARGGLRGGEKYGMCGVRDYGYIDHRLARLADLMMDVASLRVSAVRPDIITTKRREGKYIAQTDVRCLSLQRYSTGSLWIRGTRGYETNFRIAKRRDRDGYGNCRLYRAGREYNSFRSYVTSFHFALDHLQHCRSIVLWILFFFPFFSSRQRALSILSILKPFAFVVNCRQNWN